MVQLHLKPNHAPATWRIERKTRPWVMRPKPGGMPLERTLTLGHILRDLLRVATTLREVRYLQAHSEVLVNGVDRKDARHPVSFMDIVSLPAEKLTVRLTLDARGKLVLERLSEDQAAVKLTKITDKTYAKGGRVRLTCFDGRTLLLDAKDAAAYKPGDSLVLAVPSQAVKAHVPLAVGKTVLLYGGRHSGHQGGVEALEGDIITLTTAQGRIQTRWAFALALP